MLEIVIFILIIVVLAYIGNKIYDFKKRVMQEVLKNTGVSDSEITTAITDEVSKRNIKKIIEQHPNFTEESVQEILKQYAVQILNRNAINEFSQAVCEKMQKDSKIEKLQAMTFKRLEISMYSNSKLTAIAIYTDNKDEYNISLICSVTEDMIQLNQYTIYKGMIVGF